MGGVKRSLPDDWGQEGPNEEEEWNYEMENLIRGPSKKYICVGTDKVEAEWLQRWYKVPHDECVFFSSQNDWARLVKNTPGVNHLVLRPLPEGTDYVHYLKTLKTERLLNGNDVRKY